MKLSENFCFNSNLLFRQVTYYFNNNIESIKDDDYQIVELRSKPNTFNALPNGNLVIGSWK